MMSEKTKPHHFGSAREMTPEEKESVDAAFEGLKVCHPRIEQLEKQIREKEARIGRLELRIKGVIEIIQENDVTKHLEKEIIQALQDVVNEQDTESLAHIQAEAVEKFAEYSWPKNAIYTALNAGEAGYQKQKAIKYAQQLRDKAE